MLWRKILKLVFPIACLACLAVGFAGIGQWIVLLGVLLALPAWLAAFKWGSGFFPTTALVLSIGLAAVGMLISVSPVSMILGATFAFAGWDIVLFQNNLNDDLPAQAVEPFEERHYRNLTMALGLGLLVAVAGSMVRIQIPFGWMILLAAIALLGLEGLWRNFIA
ncbi:MAG: hypothetical protein ABSC61_07160 [Anaerolineales bacterium]